MQVGILKEIKVEENRVCMTPAGVELMIANSHVVFGLKREQESAAGLPMRLT